MKQLTTLEQQKQKHVCLKTLIRDFLVETIKAMREVDEIFTVLKEK
jgi:hypothetical protein